MAPEQENDELANNSIRLEFELGTNSPSFPEEAETFLYAKEGTVYSEINLSNSDIGDGFIKLVIKDSVGKGKGSLPLGRDAIENLIPLEEVNTNGVRFEIDRKRTDGKPIKAIGAIYFRLEKQTPTQ